MTKEFVARLRAAFVRERWTWIGMLAILAVALILRMGWPTLAEFKRDEAKVVRAALAIAYEGDLPVEGVGSSIKVNNPPLTHYLMALPLLLWRDPVATILFIGLLNGLAVPACYLLGRAYFNRAVGLIAAFLFAVNPWAVLYGRKLWPRVLPLVALGFIAALLATFVRRRPWALALAFVALATLLGLQLEGFAFVPVLLVMMLLYRRQVAWKPLLAGVLFCALAFAPYVIHDALQGWRNVQGFLRYGGGEAQYSWDALRYAFLLTGSTGIQELAGALYPEYVAGLPDLWGLNWLMMGLLAAALVYALVLVVRGPQDRRRTMLVLLLWFFAPIALQTRHTTPVQRHYFVLLYPVQFLLIGVMLVDLLARVKRFQVRLSRWRVALPALLLAAALLVWGGWQVAVVGREFAFMAQHPTTGGYGIPLRYTRLAAQAARRLAGPSEIIVLGTGMDPLYDETPAAFEALLFGQPHRFADGRWALPLPDSPAAVYVVGPLNENGATDLDPVLQRLAGLAYVRPGPAVVLPDGWQYRLFYREGPDREDALAGLTRFPGGLPFANNVVFMGYGLPEEAQAGETLEVWLAWWVRATPPVGADYHFFIHLVDGNGVVRGQHDGLGFPVSYWRAGDLVLSRFAVALPADLPAGRYPLWCGLYTYPGIVNVPFLDVAGNPAGDRVALGGVEAEGR
jgi:4-amino-4-deoxy-L-arabinose transferase-like glycosyltransferase